jgi:carbonic anhydrase
MRKARPLPVILFILSILAIPVWASGPSVGLSADEAMELLRGGNSRFVNGTPQHPYQNQERRTLTASQGQKPLAAVLACSDSRVPVEVVFDRGIGDIFVVRVAGNVAGADEIGSIEYAGEHLGAPLLVVLGHSQCGAVTAVVEDAPLHGSMPALEDKIKPAVEKAAKDNPGLSGGALVGPAIKDNVWQAMEDLFHQSQIIRDRVKAGQMKVVGALYDIESGKVEWLGPHPAQDKLLGIAPPGAKPKGAPKKGKPKAEKS